MKHVLALGIAASMTLSACSNLAATTQIQPGSPSVSSAQQTGSLKGRLVLPYGMQTTSRVSQAGYKVLGLVFGEAAHAEDAEASGPLDESEVQELTATVDGQAVELDIDAVTSTGDETVITYTVEEAAVGEGMEAVEITTPEGEPVGGVIVDIEAEATTTAEITPETTAVLETAIEKNGAEKIADMTAEQLSALALDPAVLNKAAAIRSILKKDGTLKAHLAHRFKQKGLAAAQALIGQTQSEAGRAKAEAAKAKAEAAKAQAEATQTQPAEPKTRAAEAKAKAEAARAAKAAAEAEASAAIDASADAE